jgi:hypothetical protein
MRLSGEDLQFGDTFRLVNPVTWKHSLDKTLGNELLVTAKPQAKIRLWFLSGRGFDPWTSSRESWQRQALGKTGSLFNAEPFGWRKASSETWEIKRREILKGLGVSLCHARCYKENWMHLICALGSSLHTYDRRHELISIIQHSKSYKGLTLLKYLYYTQTVDSKVFNIEQH